MAKTNELDLEAPTPVRDGEDEETLAAIDEGIRDADAGRVAPPEKARQVVAKWTTASATHKKR